MDRKVVYRILVIVGAALCAGARAEESASSASSEALPRFQRFQISPVLDIDILAAKNPSGNELNLGRGFGFGLKADVPLNGRWRLTPSVKYLVWGLFRSVEPESNILTPSYSFAQTLNFLALGVSVGYALGDRDVGRRSEFGSWTRPWVSAELGLEYLHPLSASQSQDGAAAVAFTNTSKPLLVLLGLEAGWRLSDSWTLLGQAKGFYNVATRSGSQLLGLRFAVAVASSFD